MRIAVLGSGPGALAVAHDMMVVGGHDATLAEIPQFQSRIDAVGERGGIRLGSSGGEVRTIPIRTAERIAKAISEAELVLLSVRAPGHRAFASVIASSLTPGTPVIFFGEGGGALTLWDEFGRQARGLDWTVAETNSLPFIARFVDSGVVTVDRKQGGVLLSSIPSGRVEEARSLISEVWPAVESAESVWTTTLLNLDAIDTVPVAITNAAAIESRASFYLLWGEGATPSVVRLVESVDDELRALRIRLGSRDERRYQDFLVAQGLAPRRDSLYETMRDGSIMRSVRAAGGIDALSRLLDLDIPWTLVLASSVGRAIDMPTSTVDSIIGLASAILGRDFRAEGRTLDSLGLHGLDAAGLQRYVATGER